MSLASESESSCYCVEPVAQMPVTHVLLPCDPVLKHRFNLNVENPQLSSWAVAEDSKS